MNIKKLIYISIGILILLGSGYVGLEFYKQESRKQRNELEFQNRKKQASDYANCFVRELNAQGLKEMVIFHYKPEGFLWKEHVKYSEKNNWKPMPPNKDRLFQFELTEKGFGDWPAFKDLRKRCLSEFTFTDEGWRNLFWMELETLPEFIKAVAEVKNINDMILEPFRENELEKQRAVKKMRQKNKKTVNLNFFENQVAE